MSVGTFLPVRPNISREKQLNRIAKKLKSKPHEAKKVERLILDAGIDLDFDLAHFFNGFPNLRFIFMEKSATYHFQSTTTPSQNNRIGTLINSDGFAVSAYFLTSNKCSRLKRLSLGPGYSIRSVLPDEFVGLFPYLPMLDTLSIDRFKVTFKGLELLYVLTPSLRSLSFQDLQMNSTKLPALIKPAPSVTTIDIAMIDKPILLQTRFFQYVTKKYPKLLKCEWCAFQKSYLDKLGPFYRNGVLSFLRPLASQLERCDLILDEMPEEVVTMLDKINRGDKWIGLHLPYQFLAKTLRIYVQTNQITYIGQLSIMSIPKMDFTFLKELIFLKKKTNH